MSRRRYLYAQQTAQRAALLHAQPTEVKVEEAQREAPRQDPVSEPVAKNVCRHCGRVLKRGKFLHERHCKAKA